MVLGQEQDIVGGNFTGSEAFYGSISQMNVWDSVLSENEIQLLASSCALDRYGNLVAWGDFLNGIDGNLQTVQPSQACQGELPGRIKFRNRIGLL
jgi:CUB/sushi domain-containing protein